MSGTTYTSPSLCSSCGYAMDAATDIDGQKAPKPGDLGICMSCGAVLVYDTDTRPSRTARTDELRSLPGDIRGQIANAQSLIRRRGRLPTRGARA